MNEKTVYQRDLIEEVAETCKMSPYATEKVIGAFKKAIIAHLEEGDKVIIHGLVAFDIRERNHPQAYGGKTRVHVVYAKTAPGLTAKIRKVFD